MSTTEPLQNQRVEAILRAALRVIGRGGAQSVRMAAVAEQAGVSKALVHYYFTTRQELLRAAFAFAAQEMDRLLRQRFDEARGGREKLEIVMLSLVEQDPPQSDFHMLWNELWSISTTDEALKALVRDSYLTWIGWVREAVAATVADGALPAADAEEVTWRLTTIVDGVQSLLYADIVDRQEGAEILRAALARELA